MKVYGKYLIVGIVGNGQRVVTSGKTRKELVEFLNAICKRIANNTWVDSGNNSYMIARNEKEYTFRKVGV